MVRLAVVYGVEGGDLVGGDTWFSSRTDWRIDANTTPPRSSASQTRSCTTWLRSHRSSSPSLLRISTWKGRGPVHHWAYSNFSSHSTVLRTQQSCSNRAVSRRAVTAERNNLVARSLFWRRPRWRAWIPATNGSGRYSLAQTVSRAPAQASPRTVRSGPRCGRDLRNCQRITTLRSAREDCARSALTSDRALASNIARRDQSSIGKTSLWSTNSQFVSDRDASSLVKASGPPT